MRDVYNKKLRRVIALTFGEFIKQIRKEKGISARELARMSGVSQPYLSQIENNNRVQNPTVEIIQKLAKGLGVSNIELMNANSDVSQTETLSNTVLMSSENHNGWKLEELLAQVKQEVSEKINKIINDPSPQAQLVVRNNLAIIEHLGAAEALQRSSYIVLDAMKANEGPTGTPRIGNEKGSAAAVIAGSANIGGVIAGSSTSKGIDCP